jgi:hypothetical protein
MFVSDTNVSRRAFNFWYKLAPVTVLKALYVFFQIANH